MRKLMVILVVNILFFTGLSASGSIEIERIGADANWLARFDCELFLKSVAGEALKTQLIKQDAEKRLNNFAIVFGFNPLKDVRNIMLYGQGNDPNNAVLLIEGKFDKARLLALVGMNPEHKEIVYGDTTIQQWRQEDKNASQNAAGLTRFGCFYRDDLIIISSGLPVLESAIDVLKGSQKSTSKEIFKDPLLHDANVFLNVAATDIAQLVGDEPQAAVLKQAEQLIMAVGQDTENVFASVHLKAESQETAENINKLLEGIIAWLSLAGKDQPELVKMSQMIKLSTVRDTIQIRLELKHELVKQIIANHEEKNMK